MYDATVRLYQNICSRVLSDNLGDTSNLICAAQDFLWYVSTNQPKFGIKGSSFLNFSIPLSTSTINYNKYKAGSVNRETQLKYAGLVTSILKKKLL